MIRRSRSEMSAVLQTVPLFAHLNKTELRGLAKVASLETYAPNTVILRQLDDAQHLIAIVSGTAKVARDGRRLATVGAGDVVGEMSMIDGHRRSAGVVAESEVEAVVLYRSAFLSLLEENPPMVMKLLLAQTARLREADKKLSALS